MSKATRTVPLPQVSGRIKELLGPAGWSEQAEVIDALVRDERGLFVGSTPLIVKPASTKEVSAVLKLCHDNAIAVVAQGGNTGLCGGAVPHESGGQILLNLSRMNRVIEVDAIDFSMTVEAGVILQTIQEKAAEADLLFPLSLGAEGSCQIGGNLATNAGGINVIRYGNTRDLVLGLEVVLADGRVLNGLKRLRKDNTGYDLRHLMVGSEGTLGIITRAVLKLFPQPRDTQSAFCAVTGPDAALKLLAKARTVTGDAVSAFELISGFGMQIAMAHLADVQDPLAERHDWYVLIELSSSRADGQLRDSLETLLGEAFAAEWVRDAVFAESGAQRQNFWKIREGLPEAQKHAGGSIKHDVSVPVSKVAVFLDKAIAAVTAELPGIRPCPFGHLGDGNIHFNLSQPEGMDKAAYLGLWADMNRIVHDIVIGLEGSISAEHGIGRLKTNELEHYSDSVKIDALQAIKHAFDPKNLLNPGKVVAKPKPFGAK